jgi:hypothetical protein
VTLLVTTLTASETTLMQGVYFAVRYRLLRVDASLFSQRSEARITEHHAIVVVNGVPLTFNDGVSATGMRTIFS